MLNSECADVLRSELPEVLVVELQGAASFTALPGWPCRGTLNGAAPAEACALEDASAAEPCRGALDGAAPAMPCRGTLNGAARGTLNGATWLTLNGTVPTVSDGCRFTGSRGLEPRDVDVWLPLPDAQGSVSLAGLAKLLAAGEGAALMPDAVGARLRRSWRAGL